MSSLIFEKRDLYPLVEHHIALLERFELIDEEPFSLIYFNLNTNPKIDYAKALQSILRKTDASFQDKTSFVILLPGTDWNGANTVLRGIEDFLAEDFSDNIVTYPEDGIDAEEIMNSLYEKIYADKKLEVKMLLPN